MLIPDLARLRGLVDEYEALRAEEAATGAASPARARDLAYTLCVSTGTRDVRQALEAARRLLTPAAAPAARSTPLTE